MFTTAKVNILGGGDMKRWQEVAIMILVMLTCCIEF